MSKTGFRVVFKPGTFDVKIKGKAQPGLDLERALVDFVITKGIATNPSGDCCTLVPSASGGGGGATNLTFSRTASSVTVESDTGTDATIPSASTTQAGVLTASDKLKLDGLTNYVHPNHSGDVTSTGDGATVITDNAVSNLKLADMVANTIKVRNASTAGDPTDMIVGTDSLVGRNAGNITNITLGTNLSMTGNVLNAAGGSGATNLAYTASPTDGTVTSDTGTDATVLARTGVNAGLMLPGDVSDIADLTTLSGVASNSTNLGTFTGTTIPDNQTVKQALQALETKTEAGDTVVNGLTGVGTVADPHKLGGTLVENTTINGNQLHSFRAENTSQVFLESMTAAGTNVSEMLLTPSNVIGAYFQTKDAATPAKRMRLGLDLDSTVGFEYFTGTGSEVVGFQINPGATLATSKLNVVTAAKTAGTTVTGQVLTLQADGSVEYAPVSGTQIMEVESDNTIIVYRVASGTPVVTASRTGGVQTISVSGGTIKIMSVTTEGQTSDLAGDNSFKIVVNGVIGTAKLAYPVIAKWNSSGIAPTDAVPHTQDIDNTPQIQVTSGTAGSSITMRAINMNAFTNWILKAVW